MRMKVLIVVKAYPAISTKYGETVCTAGITEDGDWIRIYPIPFRKLDYKNQFKKYDWIEMDLVRNTTDKRPETYRPNSYDDFKKVGRIESDRKDWFHRKQFVLKKRTYTNLDKLMADAKDPKKLVSLATFKPTEIIDFVYEKVSDKWDSSKLKSLDAQKSQLSVFDSNENDDIKEFEVVDKLPYKFSFVFKDDKGKQSKLMIEDWETGMLYWNCFNKYNGNEDKACQDVYKKYYENFAKKTDYYFFLGTTKKFHFIAPNPFVIIGDFRPKPVNQESLF